jgi:hypothetical protein
MALEENIVSYLFFGLQAFGMVAFYIYYSHKNKEAEKAYWEKLGH